MDFLRYIGIALVIIAAGYAFLSGFRTVHDYDLGWQLATGRWILQHHQVPSTELFSYTAQGQLWIYPALSGTVLYGLYLLGGYPALTWLTAIALTVTVLLLTTQRTIPTAVLAIVAVPVIGVRFTPRADLFSTLLFAAVLSLLWTYHRTGKGALWLLPVISLLWVNLHWGFVTGFGLSAAYLVLEFAEFLFADRQAAKTRLQKAWPWLLASGAASLVNPWGPSIYHQVLEWSGGLAGGHAVDISEFAPLRINASTLSEAMIWRNPDLSAIWWLLFLACLAIVAGLAQRKFWAAILLAGSAFEALQHYRFQGMFACVLVVVGGSVFSDAMGALTFAKNDHHPRYGRLEVAFVVGLCACSLMLAAVRIYDLCSNRYYLNNQPFLFGTGLSWWYPERAAAFLERERLPGNIFNSYDAGGYFAWRIPQYPIFIDSRGRPFAGEIDTTATELPKENPDSVAWQKVADKWKINTIIVPTGRIGGSEYFPKVREFCDAQNWRPVYLDEVSAIFLRRTPETEELVDRLQIDCKTRNFMPPAADVSSNRGRADLFNFWTNAGFMLDVLGRPQEALVALNTAQGIYLDSAHLHLQRGTVLVELGKLREGEMEIRRSIELEPTDVSWESLGNVLIAEQRYDEVATALRRAAEISLQPPQLYLKLGQVEAYRTHAQEALAAFNQALETGAWIDRSTPAGAEFYAEVAEGRARVWFGLGNTERALEFQEQAARLTPTDPRRWRDLANLYRALGRGEEAQRALSQTKQ